MTAPVHCPNCGVDLGAPHGTRTRYVHYGCRCPECREAQRVRVTAGYRSRVARLKADPTVAPHGSLSTYRNWGCRCEACRDAQSTAMKARRS